MINRTGLFPQNNPSNPKKQATLEYTLHTTEGMHQEKLLLLSLYIK